LFKAFATTIPTWAEADIIPSAINNLYGIAIAL
jgi:hypothetical protein